MAEGFRVSIDRIAACAGVARQTLYNHFPGKNELFSEVVNTVANSVTQPLDEVGIELRERLQRFGATLRQRAHSDEDIARFRTLVAEAPRFPELALAYFDKGPEQTLSRLADFLARAMQEGQLRQDDPAFAAQLLMSMLTGFEHTRRLFGIAAFPADQEADRITRIVDSFLRAYALAP